DLRATWTHLIGVGCNLKSYIKLIEIEKCMARGYTFTPVLIYLPDNLGAYLPRS
ncbi:MAG: hypothetical protein HY832_00740, partial [Candidatus Aenigmarchaeota archaeon]|nr:hypothetical protein [Candidatus Aenigmarchaeota archaeon]